MPRENNRLWAEGTGPFAWFREYAVACLPGWTTVETVRREYRNPCARRLALVPALMLDILANAMSILMLVMAAALLVAAHLLGLLFGVWLLVLIPLAAPFVFWEALYASRWRARQWKAFEPPNECLDVPAHLRYSERVPWPSCWWYQTPQFFIYRRLALQEAVDTQDGNGGTNINNQPRCLQFAHVAKEHTPILTVRATLRPPYRAALGVVSWTEGWAYIPIIYQWAIVGVAVAAMYNTEYDLVGRFWAVFVTQEDYVEMTVASWAATVIFNNILVMTVMIIAHKGWYETTFVALTPWTPIEEEQQNPGDENRNNDNSIDNEEPTVPQVRTTVETGAAEISLDEGVATTSVLR